ncbi:hypothetical protein N656DRAFT_457505 [Canariomyces notabilis]|uniref:Uncharacterized protein n=1 Tax=Canariomyces notabilis TaxID=2074819 RepID=A0AAN6QGT5_9PEZI|nr:hypothetical protein N656DRAFT_457505 [Canariomyces arenarius]
MRSCTRPHDINSSLPHAVCHYSNAKWIASFKYLSKEGKQNPELTRGSSRGRSEMSKARRENKSKVEATRRVRVTIHRTSFTKVRREIAGRMMPS